MDDLTDINLPPDADDLSRHAPALFALKGTETGLVVPELYFEELSELVIAKTSVPEDGGLVVPENYFEESAELIVAIAALPGEDGLIVPENYFGELPSLIEAKAAIPTESGFVVPENYFGSLSENLESQISLESALPKAEGEIPAGYFEQMQQELQAHIALDNVKQDEGFVVPEKYFEKVTDRVLSETSHIGLDATQFDTNAHDDQVPAGYFDTLHEKVVSRIEEENASAEKEERGRIITLVSWKKYSLAAAASVALILGLVWLLNGTNDNGNGSLQFASATNNLVPDNYVRYQPVIDSTPVIENIAPEGIAAKTAKKPEGVKPKSNNTVIMSDDEIIAQSDLMDESLVMEFVSENGEVEATDEVLDPAMMEYLMNDNTSLDVFGPAEKKK